MLHCSKVLCDSFVLVCRRGQLKALVDLHGTDEGLGGTLLEEEIKIMCGALDLTNKTARM